MNSTISSIYRKQVLSIYSVSKASIPFKCMKVEFPIVGFLSLCCVLSCLLQLLETFQANRLVLILNIRWLLQKTRIMDLSLARRILQLYYRTNGIRRHSCEILPFDITATYIAFDINSSYMDLQHFMGGEFNLKGGITMAGLTSLAFQHSHKSLIKCIFKTLVFTTLKQLVKLG